MIPSAYDGLNEPNEPNDDRRHVVDELELTSVIDELCRVTERYRVVINITVRPYDVEGEVNRESSDDR